MRWIPLFYAAILTIGVSNAQVSPDCVEWFKDARIDPKSKECFGKCFITIAGMAYFNAKAEKQLRELREAQQKKARALVTAIETMGPVQGGWPNYSKLRRDEHHCHLSYR